MHQPIEDILAEIKRRRDTSEGICFLCIVYHLSVADAHFAVGSVSPRLRVCN
jgi:hypothetical protein